MAQASAGAFWTMWEGDQGSTFSLHFPIPSENAFQGTLAESIR